MTVIYINKKSYTVSKLDNLLKICLSKGFNVPFFCWHPILGSVGSCRQCYVKQYTNFEKNSSSSIIMACMTPVRDKMIISINDKESEKFRKNIIELLMLNHPHDCPICAEGGNCHLQDMTVMTGHNYRRYRFPKKNYKNQYLGPFLTHEMNRCINCYRCVHYYNDYAGGKDFGVYGVNNKLYFGKLDSGDLESEFSGNLIEICPTGVFSDKTHLYNFNRKWDMQYSPSVCNFCSLGCNISAAERYGELRRIENRYHNDINRFFLCDLGRFGYSYSNILDRPKYIQKKNKLNIQFLNFYQGIDYAVHLLKKSIKFLGIGSPRTSIENNFSLYNLVGKKNFSTGLLKRDHRCIQFIINILKNSGIYTPTITEVEDYDAIFIIGEDITQTASRLALAVRQAVKKNKTIISNSNITYWNSIGIKNVVNNSYNPLFITSLDQTGLDDLSKIKYFNTIQNQKLFSESVVNVLNNYNYKIKYLNFKNILKVYNIVKLLLKSKKPLIISGMNTGDILLMQVAVDLAIQLKKKNKDVGLILLPSFSNGIGVSLINGLTLNKVFKNIKKEEVDLLIILENDLYYLINKLKLDFLLSKVKNIIVLDHQNTNTIKKSTLFFPATNFFESSGTIINYEGRAQRFFQVYDPTYYNKDIGILESWRWLHYIYVKIYGCKIFWNSLDDILNDFYKKFTFLKHLKNVSPNSKFRFIGQKIARSPNRYSGRAVIRSHINVHEIHSPQDQDTMLSFSMEGIQQSWKYSSYIPFSWYPGWNSSQSWNKFSKYIKKNKFFNDTGLLIFKKNNKYNLNNYKKYFNKNINNYKFVIVSYYKLFGSEEISQKSINIKQKIKNIFIKINFLDALKISVKNYDFLYFTCLEKIYCLQVCISKYLKRGNLAVPLGMNGLPIELLGKEVTNLRRKK